MNSYELDKGLEIIFDKEKIDLKRNDTYTTVAINEDKWNTTYLITDYPNSERLKTLYSILENDQDKQAFVRKLQKELIDSEEDEIEKYQSTPNGRPLNGLSKLCFYTLLQLGFTDEAIESFIKRKKRFRGILSILMKINLDDYFTVDQLTKLIPKIEKWDGNHFVRNILLDKTRDSRIKQFDVKIKAQNIEINQDKKAVNEKITHLGFDPKYNTLLIEIDDFLKDETHKSINAGMISCLRTFMGDLVKDTAKKIAEFKKEEIPKLPNHKEMGNIRDYIKNNLNFSDEDDKFIDSFIDILHNEGGHAFLSEKEYFRLTKNMAIEISLFILSKYEKKFKN